MKKIINYYFIPAITFLILVSVIAIRCKKPTDGINITVNTSSLFHYSALVQIIDPSGNGKVPSNLDVTVTGADAAAIYGLDGKKALVVNGGIVVAAIHPKMEPTASHPIKFNLNISGPGYLPLIVPVTISVDQKNQTLTVNILNLKATTDGVASKTTTAAATNGTITTATTVSTPTSAGNPQSTSITIPAGTQLLDVNNHVIPSNSVVITTNNFNTSEQTAVDLFPGGSLAAAATIVGGASTSAVFLPADFANIQMTANGVPVKNFSGPITVTMTLDPGFRDPKTGSIIAAGSVLSIYSYSTDTGAWQFERDVTVTASGANLIVTFTTNHLTEYVAGTTLELLAHLAVDVSAPWYKKGTATNITVIGNISNGPAYSIYKQTFQLDSLFTFIMDSKLPVPPAGSSVVLNFYDSDNLLLGTASIQPGNDGTLSVTLTPPSQNTAVTLGLSLDCRDAHQGAIIIAPDFYLLYKKTAGTTSADYAVLGQVQNGTITTTQLDPTVAYDFKAIFNTHAKEVNNHMVTGSTSTTVGNTSFNGVIVPDQNKLDIKALCESLP